MWVLGAKPGYSVRVASSLAEPTTPQPHTSVFEIESPRALAKIEFTVWPNLVRNP